MPPNAAEIEDFLCFITDSLRLIKTVLRTDNFLYVIDRIEQERVFFLNLSFLPDEFFGTEEKDDPFLHVAKSFCTSEKIYNPPIRLWKQTFVLHPLQIEIRETRLSFFFLLSHTFGLLATTSNGTMRF